MSQEENNFCQAISLALKNQKWPERVSKKITFHTSSRPELEVVGVEDNQVVFKSKEGDLIQIKSEQHFRNIVRYLKEETF